jgi:hypothetical protein
LNSITNSPSTPTVTSNAPKKCQHILLNAQRSTEFERRLNSLHNPLHISLSGVLYSSTRPIPTSEVVNTRPIWSPSKRWPIDSRDSGEDPTASWIALAAFIVTLLIIVAPAIQAAIEEFGPIFRWHIIRSFIAVFSHRCATISSPVDFKQHHYRKVV